MPENEQKENDSRLRITKEMNEATKKWKAIIDNLTERLRGDIKDVIEIQAEAISYRQTIIDEVKSYSVKIYRLVQKVKVLTKARFEFYATSYQVKTSGTEKIKLIEADLSDYQLFINELDEHVNFLRDTSKNLDNINYTVKNKIELTNILGGYK
jgi:hypothetical protein